jgi:hypothetical protein
MSPAERPARLDEHVARLEELARMLESDRLTPQQLRDLADEALAIAQQVSGLLADVRRAAPAAGPPGTPPAHRPES